MQYYYNYNFIIPLTPHKYTDGKRMTILPQPGENNVTNMGTSRYLTKG